VNTYQKMQHMAAALIQIHEDCGDVCDEYELCKHPSCMASVYAHEIASEVLALCRMYPPAQSIDNAVEV